MLTILTTRSHQQKRNNTKNFRHNMRFVLMIVWALLIITAIYYVTVIAHLFTGMFGRNIPFGKTLIPFYGWTKWFSKLN